MLLPRKVGLIGCGTIGRELARAIDSGKIGNAELISILDTVTEHSTELSAELNAKPRTFSNFDQFLSSDIDIVVEAASQDAARAFAKHVILAGKDLMIMSVGALGDVSLLSELIEAALVRGSHIYMPSGAVAGIDAIRSAKHLLDSVTLTTTKNPKALAGAPYFKKTKMDLNGLNKKTLIYEGTAADAVKQFPANVNVAAVLSLAGIGFIGTKVRIIADPDTNVNQHEITGEGSFGEIRILVRNVPSPRNPKTSVLAILSAIECLRSICNPGIEIGS